jgi:hypothetical protein
MKREQKRNQIIQRTGCQGIRKKGDGLSVAFCYDSGLIRDLKTPIS